jgi:hypothetical protein
MSPEEKIFVSEFSGTDAAFFVVTFDGIHEKKRFSVGQKRFDVGKFFHGRPAIPLF